MGKFGEWTNYYDKKPPVDTEVIVYGRPERADESVVSSASQHNFPGEGQLWYGWYEITHWMPMPEGPKTKKGNK